MPDVNINIQVYTSRQFTPSTLVEDTFLSGQIVLRLQWMVFQGLEISV
jgi:hypothetical protein